MSRFQLILALFLVIFNWNVNAFPREAFVRCNLTKARDESDHEYILDPNVTIMGSIPTEIIFDEPSITILGFEANESHVLISLGQIQSLRTRFLVHTTAGHISATNSLGEPTGEEPSEGACEFGTDIHYFLTTDDEVVVDVQNVSLAEITVIAATGPRDEVYFQKIIIGNETTPTSAPTSVNFTESPSFSPTVFDVNSTEAPSIDVNSTEAPTMEANNCSLTAEFVAVVRELVLQVAECKNAQSCVSLVELHDLLWTSVVFGYHEKDIYAWCTLEDFVGLFQEFNDPDEAFEATCLEEDPYFFVRQGVFCRQKLHAVSLKHFMMTFGEICQLEAKYCLSGMSALRLMLLEKDNSPYCGGN